MNKERGRAWVAALRSGEYTQGHDVLKGRGYLYYGDAEGSDIKHCCLGVVSELACKAGVVREAEYGEGVYHFLTEDDEYDTYLPPEVARWLEVDEAHLSGLHGGEAIDIVVTLEGGSREALSKLNDSGYTFEQIANYIEREFDLA